MKKIKVHLNEKLQRGTLLWINSGNNKVYRSSKRFDTASFNDHDSNYVGKLEKVFAWSDNQKENILNALEQVDRVYGICLQKNTAASAPEDVLSDKVVFFSSWDNMLAFANERVAAVDEAIAHKEAMKEKWLKKGRKYVQNKHSTKTSNG